MNVSVIMPSTGRAKQLVTCIDQLLKVSPTVEVVCVIEHDPDSALLLENSKLPVKVIYRREHRGPVYGWNQGAAAASGDAFMLGSDDLWFYEHWLEEALIALETIDGSGLVGINDMNPRPRKNWSDHYLVTRDYCKSAFGGVLCVPHYTHYGLDIEACLHAQDDRKYVYAEKSIVEHRHHLAHKAEKDETYMLYDEYHLIDAMIVQSRMNMGWPIDYDPVF